jgi:Protein of unknown function (DUF3632)
VEGPANPTDGHQGHVVWYRLPQSSLLSIHPRLRPPFILTLFSDPTEDSDEPLTPSAAARWQNLNSFTARLTASGHTCWAITFPIWSLRTALEEPAPPPMVGGAQLAIETRLQVASEWILRCSALLFAEMTASDGREALDEDTVRAIAPGKLCEEGMSPLGRQRWNFWREKMEAMINVGGREKKEEVLRLDEVVRQQVVKAVVVMKRVEEGH